MRDAFGWLLVFMVVALLCVGTVMVTRPPSAKTPSPAADTSAKRPTTRTVRDRGIDPAAARMGQLLQLAREEASRWQRDARLVTLRVLPRDEGLTDLTQPEPGADFLFWSDRADNCLGVLFRSGGEIRPYLNAEPLERKPLPESFVGIEDALAKARADGWKQRVSRALLSWRDKPGYGGRFAWTLVGDGSVPDDRVYCLDAVTGRPFLAMEIEEFLEAASGNDRRWIKRGTIRILRDQSMKAMWQVVDLDADGLRLTVPIRPLTDREREQVVAGGEKQVAHGPLVKLTSEQRRIFRSLFGKRAVEVGVDPGLFISDAGDKDRVRNAVDVASRSGL